MADNRVTSSKMTLVSYHLCPYVQRVAIVLAEKQTEFETIYVDLSNKPDWFLEQSPLSKTPLLKVGDEVLFESAVICEYLEETLPHPLHPSDPLQRARHRGWMEFGSATLNKIWGLETAKEEAVAQDKAAEVGSKLAWIERHIDENGPYFAGEKFSMVDVVFGPVFRYFDVFDKLHDFGIFEPVPKVRAWRQALAERPSIMNAVTQDYEERLHLFLKRKDAFLYRFVPGAEM